MTEIRLDEWLAEIERLRPKVGEHFRPEHDKVLIAARTKKPPVPWDKLARFAQDAGWPVHNPTTLRHRLGVLLADEK